MKKRITIAVIAICVIIAGIFVWHRIAEQNRQQREAILEEYERMTRLRVVAHLLALDSNQPNRYAVWNSGRFFPRGDNLLQSITYIVENSPIVFVHSEEEARAFSDDIIVGWPSSRTQARLDTINRVVGRYASQDDTSTNRAIHRITTAELFIETFDGLLTMEYIIDNPLVVWEAYSSLDGGIQMTIDRESRILENNTQEESN